RRPAPGQGLSGVAGWPRARAHSGFRRCCGRQGGAAATTGATAPGATAVSAQRGGTGGTSCFSSELPGAAALVEYCGLSQAHGLLVLPLCTLALKETGEVDGIDQERRKTAVPGHVGDNTAGEGEEQPWAFDQQDRLQQLLRCALDPEQRAIDELDQKDR